jgi:hypothetical protein
LYPGYLYIADMSRRKYHDRGDHRRQTREEQGGAFR